MEPDELIKGPPLETNFNTTLCADQHIYVYVSVEFHVMPAAKWNQFVSGKMPNAHARISVDFGSIDL